MAERKPGPVKPPTIELTARPVDPAAEPGGRRRRETARLVVDAAGLPPSEAPVAAVPDAAPEPVPSVPPNDSVDEAIAAGLPPERPMDPEVPPPPESREPPLPPDARHLPPLDEAPRRQPQQPWMAIVTAAIAGALLGTALTYVIATFVPLPSSAPVFADPAADIAEHDQRLDALEQTSAATADQAMHTQVSLDATIAQLDGGLAELRKATAEATAQTPPAADLSGIELQVRAVSSRLDAVAAGASSADSEALAQNLSSLQTALSGLGTRLDALEQGRGATEAALEQLRGSLADVQKTLAADTMAQQQAAPAVNRSAAAGALQAAMTAGRPFSAELGAARTADPDLAVPPSLAARAAAGLPDRDALVQRFTARVPDMLAARQPGAGAGWQDAAIDWLKGMLAIRPAGEVEGDAPDAVMSRLEAAMARRDLAEAAGLFEKLPPEMRAAAGDVAGDVAAWAAAEELLAAIQTAAAGANP